METKRFIRYLYFFYSTRKKKKIQTYNRDGNSFKTTDLVTKENQKTTLLVGSQYCIIVYNWVKSETTYLLIIYNTVPYQFPVWQWNQKMVSIPTGVPIFRHFTILYDATNDAGHYHVFKTCHQKLVYNTARRSYGEVHLHSCIEIWSVNVESSHHHLLSINFLLWSHHWSSKM